MCIVIGLGRYWQYGNWCHINTGFQYPTLVKASQNQAQDTEIKFYFKFEFCFYCFQNW